MADYRVVALSGGCRDDGRTCQAGTLHDPGPRSGRWPRCLRTVRTKDGWVALAALGPHFAQRAMTESSKVDGTPAFAEVFLDPHRRAVGGMGRGERHSAGRRSGTA